MSEPPDGRERRPAQAAVPQKSVTQTNTLESKVPLTSDKTSDTAPRHARRACRHLRTRHCPSCVNERRRAQDDLEHLAPVHTAVPRTVLVRVVGAHSLEVDVDRRGHDTLTAIETAGVRWMKAPTGRAWLIPHADAERVLCALEAAGLRIEATL